MGSDIFYADSVIQITNILRICFNFLSSLKSTILIFSYQLFNHVSSIAPWGQGKHTGKENQGWWNVSHTCLFIYYSALNMI